MNETVVHSCSGYHLSLWTINDDVCMGRRMMYVCIYDKLVGLDGAIVAAGTDY